MKELRRVAWTMGDDRIIKLEDPAQTCDVSEKVHTFLEKNDLYNKLDDKMVEVEIDETQGENGTITHLKVVDSETKRETPKEEPKTETTSTSESSTVKELTVSGVSVKNRSVKFAEEEAWYTLNESIDVKSFKDTCTKKKVQVTIVPTEKGNDLITAFVVKSEDVSEEKQSEKNTYVNDTQLSIEAQASMNSANRVVSSMVNESIDPEKVLRMISKIAEHNFGVIQELKNKEN